MRISRRILAGLATASLAVTATSCGGGGTSGSFDDTVTVGILHSLSGTMAISESTLVDTEKMAIEEINAAGGVKVGGKSYKIEYIVEDGASDWPTFAEKSKKLIDQDGVPVVFGGWTSASRKAMYLSTNQKMHSSTTQFNMKLKNVLTTFSTQEPHQTNSQNQLQISCISVLPQLVEISSL